MSSSRWTQEEIRIAVRMDAAGCTIRQIADVLGRTPHAVGYKLCMLEKAGKIARQQSGKPWTATEIETAKRMDAEGKAMQEIAAALGRTPASVKDKLIRLSRQGGMPKRPPLDRARRAQISKASHEAKKRTRRPCLCCGQPFMSEGPHNRLCSNCRSKSQEVSYALPSCGSAF
jgi:DNA-binding CsgD family transcriptional regulator